MPPNKPLQPAAIYMGGGKSWSAKLFQASYGYVGNCLTIWSTLALIAGLGMIVAGVAVNSRKQKIKHYKVDAGGSKTRA